MKRKTIQYHNVIAMYDNKNALCRFLKKKRLWKLFCRRIFESECYADVDAISTMHCVKRLCNISSAFVWGETPERHTFWLNVKMEFESTIERND